MVKQSEEREKISREKKDILRRAYFTDRGTVLAGVLFCRSGVPHAGGGISN
jgi:hypothetical protein